MVDREWLFVGSLNVDPRSIDINTEMGIIAHASELASDLANAAQQSFRDVAYTVELTPNGSLQWRASTEEGDVIVYQGTREQLVAPLHGRFLRHATDREPALVQTGTVDRALLNISLLREVVKFILHDVAQRGYGGLCIN